MITHLTKLIWNLIFNPPLLFMYPFPSTSTWLHLHSMVDESSLTLPPPKSRHDLNHSMGKSPSGVESIDTMISDSTVENVTLSSIPSMLKVRSVVFQTSVFFCNAIGYNARLRTSKFWDWIEEYDEESKDENFNEKSCFLIGIDKVNDNFGVNPETLCWILV